MPDKPVFELDPVMMKKVVDRLKRMDPKMLDAMENVMEYAGAVIVAHARSTHFFVGVGKGSGKVAKENETTFMNPDGTPRFKIRTGNLINSIQETPAKRYRTGVTKEIRVGMKYARWIEEGRPGARAFPFMKPALEA